MQVKLKKTLGWISASHRLGSSVNEKSPCRNLHGHNWKISVLISACEMPLGTGILIDFSILSKLKERLIEPYDHQDLSTLLAFEPTAENIARQMVLDFHDFLAEKGESLAINREVERLAPVMIGVEVEETEGNSALMAIEYTFEKVKAKKK